VHGWVTGDICMVSVPPSFPPTHNLHHPAHTQSPSPHSHTISITPPHTISITPPTHNLHHPAHTQSPSPCPQTISITPPTHALHHPVHTQSPSPRPHTISITLPTHTFPLLTHYCTFALFLLLGKGGLVKLLWC